MSSIVCRQRLTEPLQQCILKYYQASTSTFSLMCTLNYQMSEMNLFRSSSRNNLSLLWTKQHIFIIAWSANKNTVRSFSFDPPRWLLIDPASWINKSRRSDKALLNTIWCRTIQDYSNFKASTSCSKNQLRQQILSRSIGSISRMRWSESDQRDTFC